MGTKKSTNLGTLQASTGAKLKSGIVHSNLMVASDTVEVATGDIDNADVIILGIPIPTSAVVRSVKVFCDDLDSDGSPSISFDVGLAAVNKFVSKTSGTKTTRAADAILDADAFGSAVTTARAGSKVGEEVAFEANDIANVNKKVWEQLGYDEDPGGDVTVALTITAAATAAQAGTISVQVAYSE